LQQQVDYDQIANDWSLEQEADFQPSFEEYDFAGDLMPATPEQVKQPSHSYNGILNKTNTGMTLEEAYVAFDMRESYLQRHASPMAM